MSANPDLLPPLTQPDSPADPWRLLAEPWPRAGLFSERHGTVAFSNGAAARLKRLPAPLLFASSPAATAAWQAAQRGVGTPTPVTVMVPGADGVALVARLSVL